MILNFPSCLVIDTDLPFVFHDHKNNSNIIVNIWWNGPKQHDLAAISLDLTNRS